MIASGEEKKAEWGKRPRRKSAPLPTVKDEDVWKQHPSLLTPMGLPLKYGFIHFPLGLEGADEFERTPMSQKSDMARYCDSKVEMSDSSSHWKDYKIYGGENWEGVSAPVATGCGETWEPALTSAPDQWEPNYEDAQMYEPKLEQEYENPEKYDPKWERSSSRSSPAKSQSPTYRDHVKGWRSSKSGKRSYRSRRSSSKNGNEAIKGWRSSNITVSAKYLCTFLIGIEVDDAQEYNFDLRKKIVGPGGKYMKCIISHSEGVKLRLRGQGSGFLERDTGQESDEPLLLNLSVPDSENYVRIKADVSALLNRVYAEFFELTGRRVKVKVVEHPLNGKL